MTRDTLQQSWLDAIMSGTRCYYLIGEIKYIDAFKEPRTTKFRLMYTRRCIDRGSSALEICPEGNEED
jgi:hypothetical protein